MLLSLSYVNINGHLGICWVYEPCVYQSFWFSHKDAGLCRTYICAFQIVLHAFLMILKPARLASTLERQEEEEDELSPPVLTPQPTPPHAPLPQQLNSNSAYIQDFSRFHYHTTASLLKDALKRGDRYWQKLPLMHVMLLIKGHVSKCYLVEGGPTVYII